MGSKHGNAKGRSCLGLKYSQNQKNVKTPLQAGVDANAEAFGGGSKEV